MRTWRSAARWPTSGSILLGLGVSLLAAILVHPLVGLALAVVIGLVLVHPFEPFTALAALATAASFADNGVGYMTRDLSLVAVIAVYVLVAIVLARARGRWHAPGGTLPMLVLAFLAWTLFSAARGALAGHSLKFLFLELAALGATALAWVVGGLRMTPADLRPVRTILILGGLGHVALGGWSYAVNHIRAGGIWYMPLPGMFAVMALVFALHTTSRRTRLLWTVLLGLFLWHQTISFTRGYWLGLLGALPWTAAMYAGIGPGSGARWRRVVAVTATGFALLAVATIATALFNGWSDLGALIGTRFNSSFATKGESASASNMARILEIVTSLRLISHQPVLGYGLGLEIRSRQPLFHAITRQWFIHQTYVWLWLKEGLVGLALLLALLWHAVRRGVRGARTLEPEAAAWCLTAAGATIYLAIVNLTNYHIAIVNAPTLQALLWGISVALTNPPRWRLVWRKEAAAAPVAVARV